MVILTMIDSTRRAHVTPQPHLEDDGGAGEQRESKYYGTEEGGDG